MALTANPAFPVYAYPLFGRSIISAAGTSPSTATAITSPFTDVTGGTVSNGAAGVIIPAGTVAPQAWTVINFTTNPCQVYGFAGADILGVGTGFPYTLPALTGAVFQTLASAPNQINVEEVYSIPAGLTPT
jgi:hypothetical protein